MARYGDGGSMSRTPARPNLLPAVVAALLAGVVTATGDVLPAVFDLGEATTLVGTLGVFSAVLVLGVLAIEFAHRVGANGGDGGTLGGGFGLGDSSDGGCDGGGD